MAFQLTITGQTIKRVLLGLVIGAALGGLVWLGLGLLATGDPFDDRVDPDRYQAVFLSDGSAYFGRLRAAGDELYALRETFFIQEVPPQDEDAAPTQEVRSVTEQFHGPEDRILINPEHVVLIENLSPNSEVTAAIDRVLALE